MKTFKQLGDLLKGIAAKKPEAPSHAGIVSVLDNVRKEAANAISIYDGNKSLMDKIGLHLANKRELKDEDPSVQAAFAGYIKSAVVQPKDFLPSLIAALRTVVADLDALEGKMIDLFKDVKSIEDVKMSHGYIFGYLELARKTEEFFGRFLFMLDQTGDQRPPKYIPKSIVDDAALVGEYTKSLRTLRPSKKTIINDLESIAKGGNAFLMIGDQTIDDIANARDYLPQVVSSVTLGLSMNPFIWAGDRLLVVENMLYKRSVKTREWLSTKVALLAISMGELNEDDAEYAKKQKILDAYTQMIANIDEKIARYESAI